MFIVVVALVGLAGALASAARVNQTTSDRQVALETAAKIIAGMRSLPYDQVVSLNNVSNANARQTSDWQTTFCPLARQLGGCDPAGDLILRAPESPDGFSCSDPRNAKVAQLTSTCDPSTGGVMGQTSAAAITTKRYGVIAYVYISKGVVACPATVTSGCRSVAGRLVRPSSAHKMITVVAKYREPPADMRDPREIQDYSAVRLTSAVVDNPGLDLEKLAE